MNRLLPHLLLAATLIAASATSAQEDGAASEDNRRKFETLRNNPERLDRLRKDFRAFQALPAERQTEIVKLDRGLQALEPETRIKLLNVLDRYADWLARLDEKDRKRVTEAKDGAARLAVIRELRNDEWMKPQPKALRDKYANLQGAEKTAFLQKLRQEEKERKLEWLIAGRFWKELEFRVPLPARLSDFKEGRDKDVEPFVNEYLRPMLSKEEQERLDKAQGKWPLYPMTLVELADKHPPALPGPEGPRTFAELPKDVQTKFGKGKLPGKRIEGEGKWPDFAIGITKNVAKRANPLILPNELWPYNFKCLSPQMQDFVTNKLEKVLTNEEKLRLLRAEQDAKWPNYPVTIQELARNHHLAPPWLTLPGPRERWDGYRLK